MITPGTSNPPLPSPGQQVCIPFTSTGGGTPPGTVTHENGNSLRPAIAQVLHPPNTYVICFNWPSGNTVSHVSIAAGSESVTFAVAGTGGP